MRTHLADLKPNNIIFAKEDRDDLNIKIIDFGLARDLEDDLDIPISTCGTPEFTSPEVDHQHNMSKNTKHTPRSSSAAMPATSQTCGVLE